MRREGDDFVHEVGPFLTEFRGAPRTHRWTLILAAIMFAWLMLFTLVFVPYGVIRWGWGYDLG